MTDRSMGPTGKIRVVCDRDHGDKGATVLAELYRRGDVWTLGKRSTREGKRARHDAVTVLDGNRPAHPSLAAARQFLERTGGDAGLLREQFKFACPLCRNELPVRADAALATFLDQWTAAGQDQVSLDILRRAVTSSRN